MFLPVPFYLLFHCLYFSVVGAVTTCLNENGNPVDWFVIYKLPRLEPEKRFVNFLLSNGLGYVYKDSVQYESWMMPNKNISSSNSALGRTMDRVFKNRKKLSYLMYNDQPPSEKASASYGHSKGIVAFDASTGFWLIHSIPKFPGVLNFSYPTSGKENGQSILCVTIPISEINEIGKQLLYIKPKIYSKYITSKSAKKLDKNVQSLFNKKPLFVKKPPWNNSVKFRSKEGIKFWSFAKSGKYAKDLYDALVAPSLETSLFVETWRRGSGTIIPSTCNIKYIVQDVTDIDVSFTFAGTKNNMKFSSNEDHSKWAISSSSELSYVCIGDLNRMESQKKRGGGTVCFQSSTLWNAFNSSITEFLHCN